MSVRISTPTALRGFAEGQAAVEVDGLTAGEALQALTTRYPGLAKHLRTEDGKLRSFVNVYLNEDDIRHLEREATPLKSGDALTIVPAIAGGR